MTQLDKTQGVLIAEDEDFSRHVLRVFLASLKLDVISLAGTSKKRKFASRRSAACLPNPLRRHTSLLAPRHA